MEEGVPGLTAAKYTMADWYLWDAWLYQNRNSGGGMDAVQDELWDWEEGREGEVWL